MGSTVKHMPGRGPLHPMSEPELRAKFMDCAQRVLPGERAEALFARLWQLETLAAVSELNPLLGSGMDS